MRRTVGGLGRWLNSHHVHRHPATLFGWILLAALLEVMAGTGLAYLAGFDAVGDLLARVDWPLLAVGVAAVFGSWAGYWLAYRAVFNTDSGGLLRRGQMVAVAVAGFGGFLSQTAALDLQAIRAAGVGARSARVRTTAFSGLEQGVLGLGGCGAAIAILATGMAVPSGGYTWPWALIPLPGFVAGFWLAGRFAPGLRRSSGWRAAASVFADSILLLRRLFARPLGRDAAVFGMVMFWTGEVAAVWVALTAVGFHMAVAPLIVGYATGLVFTRRTVPLGGAGLMMLILPLTLWVCGAPLPAAVVAVFGYRLITLWLPLPAALLARPTLRGVCDDKVLPVAATAVTAVTARVNRNAESAGNVPI